MTHYMELLASNQPWNLILFMVIPVGLAEALMVNVVPTIEWRGFADVLAVGAYLSGVIPLLSIALLELGVIGKGKSEREHMKLHFILLIGFLVVSHVAMIFGMVDPTITGWSQPMDSSQMMNHSNMDSMHMNK